MTKGTGIAGAMDYRPAGSEQPGRTCFVCGGEIKGGVAHTVRVLPPMVEACSEACAKAPRFAQLWSVRWQPISTAPRDGREILIWVPESEFEPGYATSARWGGAHWEDNAGLPLWVDNPTHWMPLPPPPTQEGGEHE